MPHLCLLISTANIINADNVICRSKYDLYKLWQRTFKYNTYGSTYLII